MVEPTLCSAHNETSSALENIASTVRRLEVAQTNTALVQSEMATSLAVMANTLQKIEDTNVVIERLTGRLNSIFAAFEKSEKAHDELFERLRKIESVSCNARLKKVESRQDKQLWGGLTAVGLALLGALAKVLWK